MNLFRILNLLVFSLLILSTAEINAQCEVNAGNDIIICEGQSVMLGGTPVISNPPNDVSYDWSSSTGVNPQDVQNPTVSPSVTTTYTLDVGGQGCNGNNTGVDQIVVTVIPASFNVTASAASTTICAGSSLDFNSTVTGVPAGQTVTYEWSGPNGYVNSTANPTAFNAGPNSGGTYTVAASIGDCDVSGTININVIYPTLSSNQLQDFQGQEYLVKCVTGAAGGNISISDATPPEFDASISLYTIDWGDGSPVSTSSDDNWASLIHYYINGLYALTLTATGPNGCSAIHTYQVFVGSEPVVSLGTPGNTSGCAPRTLTFPITLTESNIQGTNYVIDFGDGSPTQTFNHPPPASVTHTFTESSCGESFGSIANAFGVTLSATNPCGNSQATVAPIRISTSPTAGFTANPETICVNEVSTMTSTADPGATVTATICASNAVMYWSISPSAGWSASNLGSNNSLLVNQYVGWEPGVSSLPVTFSQPGTYTISQVIANGCGGDTAQRTICVIPPPTCAFTLNPTSGCSVLSVTSTNSSQPPSCNGVPLELQYNWMVSPPTGGSGSSTISSTTSQNPTFTFTNTGTTNITFTVTLTVAPINPQTGLPMSCTTTCTQTVTVFPAPSLAPPSAAQVSCGPFDPSPFTLIFFGGGVNPQFQWYSTTNPTNPGSTGNLGTFIAGANTSTYNPPVVSETIYYFCNVTYSGAPNCATYQSGLYQAIVNTLPSVNAGSDQLICSTSIVNLSAIGSGGTAPLSYAWTPAGSLSNATIANPVASPSATTSYNVTVIDANGCTATDALLVTVNTDIVAEASGPYAVCGEAPIALNAIANGAGQWTGGTGTFSNSTSVSSTYTPVPGEVGTTVNLTWTTNDPDGSGPCNSATDQATVTISIPAFFEPLTPVTICSNSSVSLQVNTLPATGTWSGGGGFFANISSSATIYTPGSIDVANPNLNLVWTTTDPDGTGPCLPITVTQPLDVIGASTAEAAGPYAVCGEAAIALNATANGAGQWTGGTGTFSNATSVSSTYTPAQGEVGTTVNLIWTTNDPDGIGPCLPAEDMALLVVETCVNDVTGCTDILACNFDSLATESDNSCIYPEAIYLDCTGNCINDLDSDGICDEIEVSGCTNPEACNFDALATEDDGSCEVLVAAEIIGNITPDAFSVEDYSYASSVAGSTLQWTITNGIIISGQGTEAVQIQWAGEGMGAVQVQEIVDADCIGPLTELNVVVLPVQGVLEYSNSGIMVYPNPAIDEFRVKSRSSMTGCGWKLMDITGRVVQQGIFQSAVGIVSLSNCDSGQYVLQVESKDEIFEERVIKLNLH